VTFKREGQPKAEQLRSSMDARMELGIVNGIIIARIFGGQMGHIVWMTVLKQ
jgi:hypothetical protein